MSLNPPLLLVCLRNESDTLAALLGHGHFAVNVLHQDQLGHAQRFAKRSTSDSWHGVAHRRGRHDLPLLDGAVATLQCKLHDVANGGDHTIVIGRVLAVDHPEDHVDPLLFYRGAFARLGKPHEPPRVESPQLSPSALDVFLPTSEGELRLLPVEHGQSGPYTSVIALVGDPQDSPDALLYLHAGCLFGDALGHLRCPRRAALSAAMARIRSHGSGVLVYHRDDSSPFTGCCAQGEDTAVAATTPASVEAVSGLRSALDRLQLSDVRLLRVDRDDDWLDPVALGLEVTGVEQLQLDQAPRPASA